MRSFKQLHIIIPLVLLLGILQLACASSTPSAAPTVNKQPANTQENAPAKATKPSVPTDTPVPAPTDTLEPTPTKAPAEQFLGDTIEQDGLILTAVQVADPAEPGMFYNLKEGERLVAVEIIVGNKSGETHSVNPLNATLVDTDGFVYTLELGGIDDQLAANEITSGEKVRGWVAFSIPETAGPAKLKYSASFFGGDAIVASLTPPPEGHMTTGGKSVSAENTPSAPETYLGDTVEVDGYGLSVVDVQDPAEPGQFFTLDPDKKLVAVEIVISNIDGDDLSVNPLSATLVDNEGYTYQPELGGIGGMQIGLVTLSPGERIKGWVPFEIPPKSTVAAVKFNTDFFGNAFKTGALTRPRRSHDDGIQFRSRFQRIVGSGRGCQRGRRLTHGKHCRRPVETRHPVYASIRYEVGRGRNHPGKYIQQ